MFAFSGEDFCLPGFKSLKKTIEFGRSNILGQNRNNKKMMKI